MTTRIGEKKTRARAAKPTQETPKQAEDRRERCIAEAVKILGDKSSVDEVSGLVHLIDARKQGVLVYSRASQDHKEAAKSLGRALRRAESLLTKTPGLYVFMDVISEEPLELWLAQLKKLKTRAEKLPLEKPRRHDGPLKRLAVKEAAKLLKQCGHTIRRTRGSKFCRLASLLFADDTDRHGTKLYHQCCAFPGHTRA